MAPQLFQMPMPGACISCSRLLNQRAGFRASPEQ